MGIPLEEWPPWSESALQGLAFWMGHRHSLYRDYPLSEGALVAEACNLIQANLRAGDEVLLCERMYRTLVTLPEKPKVLTKLVRADLVVATLEAKAKRKTESIAEHVRFIIEVKRGDASWAEIEDDLKRLDEALRLSNKQFRCFLFVICESRRRNEFISKEGKSILGMKRIDGTDGHYRVRRTCKAAASFGNRETAHYACLLEVFREIRVPVAKRTA